MKTHVAISYLSLAVLAGCSKHEPRRAEAPPAPVAVEAIRIETSSWPDVYEAIGTVRARHVGTVSSKLMGYVREVKVRVGERVRRGQLVVTVDARDLEAARQRAEAGREEAQNAALEADNAIAGAKANLELAQVTFKRFEDLYSKKSVSNQEFDEAASRMKSARANYEMALARKRQAQSKIVQAEQEIQAVSVNLGYAGVTAPFDGVVTEKNVEAGNLAVPGAPLMTIEQAGSYRLEASVEESRLPLVRQDQAVPVTFDALTRTVNGRVAEIVPAVDAASRTFTVKIDIPAMPELRSGLFGRASFATTPRQAIVLPPGALIERGQLQSVMVADGGMARNRLLTVGRRSPDRVEILSGLMAGDRVIFPLPPGLEDGARIEVR